MIYDNIKNAHLYASLGARFQQAFDYLQQTDLLALPVGRIELDGKNLYVMVQEYTSKLPEQGKWEAHQRYIDLQYIVSGVEKMGFAALTSLTLGAYTSEKDFQALSGEGVFLPLGAGDFMLLWPQDAHMPGMAINTPGPVKKVVVKIAVG
ncbi:MAG TPA: YhcH/YjgK/YiaL family protein [Anaerolineae bacterium]